MTAIKPTGSVRTADAFRAGEKLAHDVQKLDTNHDGVVTQRDLARNAKRLGFSKAETEALSTLLENTPRWRSGRSLFGAGIEAIYGGGHISGLDAQQTGTVSAKQLNVLTRSTDKNAYAIVADVFEYAQSMEKAK
ncbi:MAG: hypothetical protein JST54_20140 [Deltaproteobacteria bacterium]|nr:hypothetical protein [Deltaproteobacteria bacterium]